MNKQSSFKTLLFPVCVFVWMLSSSFQFSSHTQNPADVFWDALKKHCGKAYEGKLAEGMSHATFNNQKLIMHIRQCDENTIKIPLIVGEDRSRTWVLTKKDGIITLKHDHRHEDGSEDAITQYGGTSTNAGFPHMQVFPADAYTAALIDYAATNIWWMTLKEDKFTYNLRRIEGNSYVSLEFNLKTPVAAPEAPWGWED
jgi:hypothetical protein